jgi:tRNA(Ile)-lysidine synthase
MIYDLNYMLDKIKGTVRKYDLLSMGDRVVVAVSGGPDSVCLLKLLTMLVAEYRLELLLAHLNHGMRGVESDRDEDFVRTLGETLHLEVVSKKIRIPELLKGGVSAEDLCREERYKFLIKVCKDKGFTKIALGHHQDDQVETVLINILRGTGMEGLKGILPNRKGIFIRPLFEVRRSEIAEFIKKEKLTTVIDSSNESDQFLRNRLRRNLIPLIEKDYNPAFSDNMSRMAEIAALENDYLKQAVDRVLEKWGLDKALEKMKVDIASLLSCHPALQRRIVKTVVLRLTPGEKGISYAHVRSVLDLAAGDSPSGRLDLPFGIRIYREYGSLLFSRRNTNRTDLLSPEKAGFCMEAVIPGIIDLPVGFKIKFEMMRKEDWEKTGGRLKDRSRLILFDYDRLSFPLVIRNVLPGDRIRPAGMTGTKKISDFFIDAKIARFRRPQIPLLVDRDSVLWIIGMRLSDKAMVTEGTKRILKVEII